jgi:hypothetical protein
MYLSRQLAQLHPELTMPMFSGKFIVWKLLICYCEYTMKLIAKMELAPTKNLPTTRIGQSQMPIPELFFKKKLRGLSPRANYIDRATASCRRN